MLTLLAALCVVAGTALVASSLGSIRFEPPPRPELPRALAQRREELTQERWLVLWERAVLFLTPKIEGASWARAWGELLEPHLKRLAYPYGLLPMEWVSTSLLVALLSGTLAFTLFLSPILFLVAASGGFFFPFLWLRGKAQAEERRILKEFPDFLDTVSLLVEAGLDLASSIERFSRSMERSTLARHLELMVLELKAGSRLMEVLEHLEKSLAIEELKGFFATLRESVRTGGSLVPVLRVQADTLRQRRFERAEKQAMEATVKMMLPLLLIFAAVLVIVVGPLLIQLIGGF